jgi:divalent metal cation (Fe/Co/Zn/Cd) transporter
VSLHVQVDPSLPLDRAHEIAESVERGIEESVPEVRQVTVHLEPSIPESGSGTIVDDQEVSNTIRSIVREYPEVLEINAITIYAVDEKLHISVHCLFAGAENISVVHNLVSRIEESIRQKFKTAVVTIHSEPDPRQK